MCEHGRCDSCGDSFPRKELTPVGSSLLCPECLDTATTTCAHCGERIFWDENAGNRATPLCQSCYERYYTECSRCGAMIRQSEVCYYDSDDEPLCSDCYNRTSKYRSIHDYYFKPAPIFYGEGPRYFGVEAVFWTEPIIDLTAAVVSTTFFMTCSGRILKKRLEVGKERMHMRQA